MHLYMLKLFSKQKLNRKTISVILYIAGTFTQGLMKSVFLWRLHLLLLCEGIIVVNTIIIKGIKTHKLFPNPKSDRNLLLNVCTNAIVLWMIRYLKMRSIRPWSAFPNAMADDGAAWDKINRWKTLEKKRLQRRCFVRLTWGVLLWQCRCN